MYIYLGMSGEKPCSLTTFYLGSKKVVMGVGGSGEGLGMSLFSGLGLLIRKKRLNYMTLKASSRFDSLQKQWFYIA